MRGSLFGCSINICGRVEGREPRKSRGKGHCLTSKKKCFLLHTQRGKKKIPGIEAERCENGCGRLGSFTPLANGSEQNGRLSKHLSIQSSMMPSVKKKNGSWDRRIF
jgi:hypothetical protein